MCNFCKIPIFIKIPKIQKSVLAPLTYTEELINEIEDITGEIYMQLSNYNYCPICGEKLGEENKQ